MPFRQAHSLAGQMVTLSEEMNLPLNKLPLERIQRISPLFDAELVSSLNSYESSVEQYTSTGGTSRAAVLDAIAKIRFYFSKQ